MKVIRDLELKDLVDKYCDYRNKLDDLITGVPMPDPVEGEVHSIGYHDQVLHNGKLKEPFREIDDLEIENTMKAMDNIVKKILKLENHRHDIYAPEYTVLIDSI